MGETITHIPDHESALRTLEHEHDRLVKMVMTTVDALSDVQRGEYQLNVENLRRAGGKALRESIELRDAAIAVLADC